MSKSYGNVISPLDIIDRFGADTLRTYVLSSSAPWEDLKFNLEEVETSPPLNKYFMECF